MRAHVEDIYRAIGERVRDIRKECGLTQEQLAEQVGLSRPAIANIEVGRQRIYLHDLDRMAEIFRVPLSEMIGEPSANRPELSRASRLLAENRSLKRRILKARNALKEPVN